MKNRSARDLDAASQRCSKYPPTTLALWARYHDRADGARKKSTQCCTPGRDGSPSSRSTRSFASRVSRSRSSLTARHHGLPGASESNALSTPRSCCHRMNATTARRYGRYGRPTPHSAYVSAASRMRALGIVTHLRHHPRGVPHRRSSGHRLGRDAASAHSQQSRPTPVNSGRCWPSRSFGVLG